MPVSRSGVMFGATIFPKGVSMARPPAKDELADGVAFLGQQAEAYRAAGKPDAADFAIADFCQALMCLNEFVYVD